MKHNFKNLEIWKDAVNLSVEIYKLTDSFPDREKFSLTSQIRKCAISIPSNIAEGAGKSTNKDFANFLSIANGSSNEVETQLIIAQRLGYIDDSALTEIARKPETLRRRTCGLQSKLNAC